MLALVIFLVQRYTPSKERMALTDYFVLTEEDQAAVIVDGTYYEDEADTPVHGIYQDGHPYLEISFLKEYLDDGMSMTARKIFCATSHPPMSSRYLRGAALTWWTGAGNRRITIS